MLFLFLAYARVQVSVWEGEFCVQEWVLRSGSGDANLKIGKKEEYLTKFTITRNGYQA